MENKSFVFDFDGVIGDSRVIGYAIHNQIKDKYGLPPIKNQDDYWKVIDDGHLENYLTSERIALYYRDCNYLYESQLSMIGLFPYIKALLRNATQKIIIVSSNPDSFIRRIIQMQGIDNAVIYGKEKAKTKKERIALLLEQNDLSIDNLIYIGDTIDDFRFCGQMGIPMIGSNYGYSNLTSVKDSLVCLIQTEEDLANKIHQYLE